MLVTERPADRRKICIGKHGPSLPL
jgi:hypothetical protein